MTEEAIDIKELSISDFTGSERLSEPPSSTLSSSINAPTLLTTQENSKQFSEYRAIKLLDTINPSNKLRYRNQLQSDFEFEQKTALYHESNIKLKLISWNLNQLSVPSIPEFTSLLQLDNSKFADFYIINFQETISLRSMSHSDEIIRQWCNLIIGVLPVEKNYKVVSQNGVLGLTTILIATSEVYLQVSDVRFNKVGLGYLSWYNKGCLEVRFNLGKINKQKLPGVEFQILNMHLVHGEEASVVNQRRSNLEKVENTLGLAQNAVSLTNNNTNDSNNDGLIFPYILSEGEQSKAAELNLAVDTIFEIPKKDSLILVSGDLNYRLSDLDKETCSKLLESENVEGLLKYDQLTNSKNKNEIFSGFEEGAINFKPTFKIIDKGNYNMLRIPSYTDRILYSPSRNLKQVKYNSFRIDGSDHLPVFSEFELKYLAADYSVLDTLKTTFNDNYNKIIDEMEILEVDPISVSLDTVVGLEEIVSIKLKNLCNESLSYCINDINRSIFRRSEVKISNLDDPTGYNELPPKETKTLKFEIMTTKLGTSTKMFNVSLKTFTYLKNTIDLKINSQSIINVPLLSLTDTQYSNILRSFQFLLKGSKLKLTERLNEIETEASLIDLDKFVLKDMSLSAVNFELLTKLNEIGMTPNEGSCALMNVIYLWLKHVPEPLEMASLKGKTIFSSLIRLIHFLDMDEIVGYRYFGFLFSDEYELKGYLDTFIY